MDFFGFITSLLTIVFIDLVLAGDNAIVIGLAARNLPKANQKKAILWGTGGAVLIRIAATLVVVWLLKIPWLLFAGGLLLTWIALKLLVEEKSHDVQAGSTLWASVRTIIIADAAMGLDNVIAVAGAAHGHPLLVILGLLISVPIVVWGSTLFVSVINRFPWVVYLGSGVLAYTAAKMITHEPKFVGFFDDFPALRWTLIVIVIIGVVVTGKLMNDRKKYNDAARKTA